jgi:predicted transcriptional regulator
MAKVAKPTEGELAILGVLWQKGEATVREVHEALGGEGAYTTVLKLLQIMTEKGLVKRDVSARTHVYRAAEGGEKTQRRILRDLMEKAFGGSAGKLVLRALSAKRASAEELAEIRRMIEAYERGQKEGG